MKPPLFCPFYAQKNAIWTHPTGERTWDAKLAPLSVKAQFSSHLPSLISAWKNERKKEKKRKKESKGKEKREQRSGVLGAGGLRSSRFDTERPRSSQVWVRGACRRCLPLSSLLSPLSSTSLGEARPTLNSGDVMGADADAASPHTHTHTHTQLFTHHHHPPTQTHTRSPP